MSVWYLLSAMILVACGTVFWSCLASSSLLLRFFSNSDIIATPMVGSFAIILGFFVGFGGADMRDRSRELRHFALQEANEARSILKFAEGAGDSASSVRQAMIEYLQAATTTERNWIEAATGASPPGQPMVDSLVLFTTAFSLQKSNSDSLKTLLVSSVGRLRDARVSRLGLSRQGSSIPEWIAITALALITQAMIALTHVGKPRAISVCSLMFSLAIYSVYLYLAWIDGLVGASKATLSITPLKEVLSSITY